MKRFEKSDCFRQSVRILGGLEKLNKTHQFVWLHANNFGYVERVGEEMEIPAYVEATYLKRTMYHTYKADVVSLWQWIYRIVLLNEVCIG